ncbi:MAG: GNAT family N-acetyltransferase [Actinobacteria bacterium]|nr:GNAT family N-acetyltransferase [Actinomycetota bacterium]
MNEVATHRPAAQPGSLGWEVRPAREEDASGVAAAVAALVAELGGSPPARAAIEAEARAHIADPSLGIVLVAAPAVRSQLPTTVEGNCERTGGGELVGVLTASWARAIQVAGRLLTIEVLWTRREWRDRGVGAALVEALAAAAAAEGAGRVEVGLPRESFAALRATERFYLANGFERLGPRMRRAVP